MSDETAQSDDWQLMRPFAGWRFPILLAVWIAFIFGTSCTVVRPDEFFSLIASVTGAGRSSMEKFALFWGITWFTIVKGWHFTEFAILTGLCAAAFKWWCGRTSSLTIGAAMLFCLGFAASDEWHQTFVPDRYGTFQDVLIDGLGVCVAGAVMLIRLRDPQTD